MGRFVDALARAIEIAALPVTAGEGQVLDAFAKLIGAPTRFAAFQEWRATLQVALPFCHQRLATLTVRPEGSPDGEPVDWLFAADAITVLEAEHELEDQLGGAGIQMKQEMDIAYVCSTLNSLPITTPIALSVVL